MPAAVLFCRVSTQKQAARNESNLPTQQKRCEDWCKSESLPVIRVFVAEGESAWDTDRPVFEECLDFIQKNKGRVSVLCVQDISRFSRNIQQQAVAMAQLTKLGVRLVSVDEPMLDDSPVGLLTSTILLWHFTISFAQPFIKGALSLSGQPRTRTLASHRTHWPAKRRQDGCAG
jgi:DNA invertase Pin-like site-specific DNA recombinase